MNSLEDLKYMKRFCKDLIPDCMYFLAPKFDNAIKDLKAFEIINKKEVDMYLIDKSKSVKEYNCIMPIKYNLTQDQFDLLKEVLK